MSESEYQPSNVTDVDVAGVPTCEPERLIALHALNVLDKPAEQRFDLITTLAADIFDVPMATVSLVDKDRQFFMSRCGLDITESDRTNSFCSYALFEDVMLVVEDALADPRFATHPFVVNPPHLRFYAGVVIFNREGLPLGTLCLMATESRKFESRDRAVLKQLGALVEGELLPDNTPMQMRVRSQLDAQIDPLTRAYVTERFLTEVEQQKKTASAASWAVAMIVLPGLDQLNDIFGRVVGDELMIEVASRLHHTGSQFDSGVMGRLSGRRFALSVCSERADIGTVLHDAINRNLGQVFVTSGGELTPDLHAGIASAKPGTNEVEFVLERCRAALATMASAKGSQVVLYDEQHLLPIHRRLRIAAELRSAIDNDVLNVVYQPKVRCSDRVIDGFECLLRWQHAELGPISPLDILDSARDVNQLVALDRWVIEQAIIQRAAWLESSLEAGTLSVNVTGETLLSTDFISWLGQRLEEHGVDAGDMELEVLESSLFEDFDCAVAVLEAIQNLGVGLSLDDFGTGYSSLAYLYRLPISVLKIDRAFISRLEMDTVHRSLCTSIMSMAHDLALSVVAEGVENESQFKILQAFSCDRAQGYLFSRPVSAEDATKLLQSSGCASSRIAA